MQKGIIIGLILVLILIGAAFYNSYQRDKAIKQLGEEEKKVWQTEDNQKKTRDLSRKADTKEIAIAQEMFYADNDAYLTSVNWPSNIGSFMPETPTDSGNGVYIWIDNTRDSQKYCAYAVFEEGGWVTASHRGNFECSDSVPTLNDCCF